MEVEINVAVNYEKVVTEKTKVNLPETAKYYYKYDDSAFFGRGEILFGIIPYMEASTYFSLIQVHSNLQMFNDFRPTKDCKQSSWIGGSNDSLRKEAFEIFTGKGDSYQWKEISETEFEEKREILLNKWKK
ncbi:MAG: hypothetical protein ABIP51_05950 [Bacteroidia bacterium]